MDSSPAMLELNRGRFGTPNVTYVQADLFDWESEERFDAALVGFFVSHIPPGRWSGFWDHLASRLEPGGSLFIADDVAGPGRPSSGDVVEDGPSFAHRRKLSDGREYTIVKRFYEPDELVATLDTVGWDAEIGASGEFFLYGTARPRSPRR